MQPLWRTRRPRYHQAHRLRRRPTIGGPVPESDTSGVDDAVWRGLRQWSGIGSWWSKITRRRGMPSEPTMSGWGGPSTWPAPCCPVLGLVLPDGEGTTVLERVREKGLRTHVAVCTGTVDLARPKAA